MDILYPKTGIRVPENRLNRLAAILIVEGGMTRAAEIRLAGV